MAIPSSPSTDPSQHAPLAPSHQICDAEEADEGRYEVCVEVGSHKECVQIDLIVLAVCEDDEGNETVVSV